MKVTIYRGTKEIGGTLIELKSKDTRILIDAGYPLFLNDKPIDNSIAKLPYERLIELGVLPLIEGLYSWDKAGFDAVIISHAHLDHYGLLKYINPAIPVYISAGTRKIIEISQMFKITDAFSLPLKNFKMYEAFHVGDFTIKPFLMDHSAFDAAAFEISSEGKTIIYTGDFRGHGRKAVCLDRFISGAAKKADVLLTEGTMFGRQDEKIMTENELEDMVISEIGNRKIPVLFQSSSQNIDRLVSFYRAALKLGRIFVVDIYTANVLYELRQLGNNLPYPSKEYANIKVFYPYRLTQKIFNDIGEDYAKRFSAFHISKPSLSEKQNNIIMTVRPSMQHDIEKCSFHEGLFIYSLWQGYRDSEYQQRFEDYLRKNGFESKAIHTSGHASTSDIERVITGLEPKQIIPIHTMAPNAFQGISNKTVLKEDGKIFEV
jgi:ribonuclease J